MRYRGWNSGTILMLYEMPAGMAGFRFTKAYAREAGTNRMWFRNPRLKMKR